MFIVAGILQLPLQLHLQMKQVTIALVVARVVQVSMLAIIVFFIAPQIDFSRIDSFTLSIFALVVGSVVMSALAQGIYVWRQGQKFIKLRWNFDRHFTRDLMRQYWQYGVAYYLSSFHTLIVLILLSIFYRTIDGFVYVGIWALALSLVEMLLIIPSALGNSLIHRVAHTGAEHQRTVFGKLMAFMIWVGAVVALNFFLFHTTIIRIISGEQYLSTTLQGIGSDFLLPFFGIVLILNFVKQVCNYLFVAAELQNKLLQSNLRGVLIGAGSGIFLVKYR
jgi:O-antigen/teichoic acid export membrane protein